MKTEWNLTQVQIFPTKNQEGKLRAFARIVLEDALVLSSLRIYEGTNGIFVSFPSEQSSKGEEYRHIYYPSNKDLREQIQKEVLAVYQAKLEYVA